MILIQTQAILKYKHVFFTGLTFRWSRKLLNHCSPFNHRTKCMRGGKHAWSQTCPALPARRGALPAGTWRPQCQSTLPPAWSPKCRRWRAPGRRKTHTVAQSEKRKRWGGAPIQLARISVPQLPPCRGKAGDSRRNCWLHLRPGGPARPK